MSLTASFFKLSKIINPFKIEIYFRSLRESLQSVNCCVNYANGLISFQIHDGGGRICKGGSRENTIAKYGNSHSGSRFPRRFDEDGPGPPGHAAPKLIAPLANVTVTPKDINKMFGITASDIDKYSRVIFPITFVCFQLMYWIIYQHLSDIIVEDLVFLQKE